VAFLVGLAACAVVEAQPRSDDAATDSAGPALDAARYPSLAAAASAAASGRKSLVIRSRQAVRSGTVVIAAPLRFEDGGAIDVSQGDAAVEIAGPLAAPPGRQVFFAGGGAIRLRGRIAEVRPAWWGAKGDGVADDTAALRAAVAAARDVGGAVVGLPAGTFTLSSVELFPNVTLRGVGRDVTTLRARPQLSVADRVTDATGHPFDGVPLLYTSYPRGAAVGNVVIEALTVDGNWRGQVRSDGKQGAKNLWGVYLNKPDRARISDVRVTGCLNHGITLKEASGSLIERVLVDENGQSAAEAANLWNGAEGPNPGGDGLVLLSRCRDNLVVDSIARRNGSIGFEDEGRYGTAVDAGHRNRRNRWVGLRSEENKGHAFLSLFTDGALYERCTAVASGHGAGSAAFNLVGTAEARLISPRAERAVHHGIWVRPETYGPTGINRRLTIAAAEIVDTTEMAIRVEGLEAGSIEATIRGVCGPHAVSIVDSSDLDLAVDYDAEDPDYAGKCAHHRADYGIYTYDAKSLTIHDTRIRGCGSHNIWIDGAPGGVSALKVVRTRSLDAGGKALELTPGALRGNNSAVNDSTFMGGTLPTDLSTPQVVSRSGNVVER
jgi:hypothetical protein